MTKTASVARTSARICRTVLGAGIAVGLWATLIERQAFVLREYTVPMLPPGSPETKILHISDLHLLPGQQHKISWVRSLAELQPDFVVNTGDNLGSSSTRVVAKFLEALEPLLNIPGAFVTGSNDYYAPTFKNPLSYLWKRLRKQASTQRPIPGQQHDRRSFAGLPTNDFIGVMLASGWVDLDNQNHNVTLDNGLQIALAGTGDAHIERDREPQFSPEASSTAAVRIGLTHAPYRKVLEGFARQNADLVLAGHTHGGQVCVPGYGALVSNCDLPPHLAQGTHVLDTGMHLSISAGLGHSPYAPFRLACRPEASLITLSAGFHQV